MFLLLLNFFLLVSPQATVRLEPTNPVVDQGFNLIVTIDSSGSAAQPDLPTVPGLSLNSTSSSTNVSIVNGKTTMRREFSYTLVPQRAGQYTIPPITIDAGGQKTQTAPLNFTVAEIPAGSSTADAQNGKPYFAISTLSKEHAYVGEPLLYTVKLYFRTQVSDVKLNDPESSGFWVEAMGEGEQSVENVQGQQYRVLTVRRALYPNRPGKLKLTPGVFDFYTFQRRGGAPGDLFDRLMNDPFFNVGIRREAHAASGSHDVDVLPLPETNKPTDFSGIVGDIRVRLGAPAGVTSVARGSSVTLTTEISGNANLRSDIKLDWGQSSSFKRYEDKPLVETYVDDGALLQQRIYKTAIVPLKEGDLQVGPLSFSYFDPKTRTYKRAVSENVRLQVTPGDGTEVPPPTASSVTADSDRKREAVKLIGDDILPNHSGRQLLRSQALQPLAWRQLGMLFFPPLLAIAVTLMFRRRNADPSAQRLVVGKRAKGEAIKRLETALRPLKPNHPVEMQIGTVMHAIYTDYLRQRLQVTGGVLTAEELRQALSQLSLDVGSIEASVKLLNDLEAIRLGFYYGTPPPEPATRLAQRTQRVIEAIDASRIGAKQIAKTLTMIAWVLLATTALGNVVSAQSDSAATTISQAEAAYSNGDFTNAKRLYLQTIIAMGERGEVNGHLLYNLGNCYFRLHEYGWAMLQYRRARLFLPDDRDLLANMEIVADKLKVPLPDADSSGIQQLFFWLPYFSFHTLWCALIVINLLVALWLIGRRFVPSTSRFWGDVTLLPLLGLLLLSFAAKTMALRQATGGVIGPTAQIRSGRGDDFIPIVQLNQGSGFTILEADPASAWWKIAVDAGEARKGYAKAELLGRLGAWNLIRGKNISTLFSREYSESSIDTAPPAKVQ